VVLGVTRLGSTIKQKRIMTMFFLSVNITFTMILSIVALAMILSFTPNTSAITKVFALLLLSAAVVLL
jgi:hypothetical protein